MAIIKDVARETGLGIATIRMAFDLAANKANLCFIGTPHVDLTFTPKHWENMNRKEFKNPAQIHEKIMPLGE